MRIKAIKASKKLMSCILGMILVSSCNESDVKKEMTLKEALGDKFLVGVTVNDSQARGEDPKATEILTTHFNSVVAENCMKHSWIHPQKDKYDFKNADDFVAMGEKYNMFIIGHCLIWHSQLAEWFYTDENGNDVSPEVLKQRMKEHITTIVKRYKGKVKGWDVVNEAIMENGSYRESKFYEILGEEFIPLAFQYAHEADPDAELYYNDYNMHEKGKRATVMKLIRKLQSRNIPITAVGMQGHLSLKSPNINAFEQSIKDFSSTGVKVMITELDMSALPPIPENATEAEKEKLLNPYPDGLPEDVSEQWNDRMMDFMELFVKYSNVISRVNVWGITDKESWKNYFPHKGRTDYPVFFDRNYQPKPFIQEIMNGKFN